MTNTNASSSNPVLTISHKDQTVHATTGPHLFDRHDIGFRFAGAGVVEVVTEFGTVLGTVEPSGDRWSTSEFTIHDSFRRAVYAVWIRATKRVGGHVSTLDRETPSERDLNNAWGN